VKWTGVAKEAKLVRLVFPASNLQVIASLNFLRNVQGAQIAAVKEDVHLLKAQQITV
jgi:hypothetical protein